MKPQPLQDVSSMGPDVGRTKRPLRLLIGSVIALVIESTALVVGSRMDRASSEFVPPMIMAIVPTFTLVFVTWRQCLPPRPPRPPKPSRAERRILAGKCAACGADVRGADVDRCPACGWLVPRPQMPLRWPNPDTSGGVGRAGNSRAVQAYFRAVMRGRPPGLSPAWGDGDPRRSQLIAGLAEACRDGNQLESAHFLPEDSFAVATASGKALFWAEKALPPQLGAGFQGSIEERLRTMTFAEVIQWALEAPAEVPTPTHPPTDSKPSSP